MKKLRHNWLVDGGNALIKVFSPFERCPFLTGVEIEDLRIPSRRIPKRDGLKKGSLDSKDVCSAWAVDILYSQTSPPKKH